MKTEFSAASTIAGLKDFQRRSVEYVFKRMFLDSPGTSRFLVADEVGLGKTMVAKGLVAKAIEHLQDQKDRIDIVYVCSNADIARQNVDRLAVAGLSPFSKATRLTLLPLEIAAMRAPASEYPFKVNLVSFTPGTTFDQGNRTGKKPERRLIYQMLKGIPGLNSKGLMNALQGTAGFDGWVAYCEDEKNYDAEIGAAFAKGVVADTSLFAELSWACDRYSDRRTLRSVEPADKERCLRLVGNLRKTLAKECLHALEPDLVILDEFQRFRDLLKDPDEDPAAELAHALFNYPDVRVLLLSATPYKMYSADADEEDHYVDFLKTIGFLKNDQHKLSTLDADLKEYRKTLLAQAASGALQVADVLARVEASLLEVMCRTDRIGHTTGMDAMVKERPIRPVLKQEDLRDYRFIDGVANVLGQRSDGLEYWKSGPYLLNFMKGYQLKEELKGKAKKPHHELSTQLSAGGDSLLKRTAIETYSAVDAGNPRLRALIGEIESSGMWKLLWMPASLPYWQPSGAYAGVAAISKQLVFSGWNLVPDAIAALVSYAVERRLIAEAGFGGSYENMFKRLTGRIRFAMDDGRPAGMYALAMMFPAPTLADLVDPVSIAGTFAETPDLDSVRSFARARIEEKLKDVVPQDIPATEQVDRRWYWAALAMIESRGHPELADWCRGSWSRARSSSPEADAEGGDGGGSYFDAHVEYWTTVWQAESIGLGRVPDDLADVLTDMALGGPAVCAFRAMRRALPGLDKDDHCLMDAAVRVAEGMRTQFNHPLAVAALRTDDVDAYWMRVLRYGVEGNLQAVLDEYAHVLRDQLGPDADCPNYASRISDRMSSAMSLQTSQLRPDEVRVDGEQITIENFSMRCHIARRLADTGEEIGPVFTKEMVRESFNSPFRPFVLASTSVGQEGLDFHVWCHSVVHWNLPSNPVDMEQREGRVNRYKGYAVRKNVASRFRDVLTVAGPRDDVWAAMFARAYQTRPVSANDLVPYWIYDIPDGEKIERRVFDLAYSRDTSRYRALKKGLSLYRLVFAQPRQEDLLAYLGEAVSPDRARDLIQNCLIRLRPPLV